MARSEHKLFVGIKDVVVAVDPRDGSEIWRSKIAGAMDGFVNVMWDGEMLIAASAGEVYRLDPKTGAIMWHNKFKGLGLGVVTVASTRQPTLSGNPAVARAGKQEQAN